MTMLTSDAFTLSAVVDEELTQAAASSAGRAARTLYGGHEHRLRQTLVAMTAGSVLAEHESPGEATLQVLRGRVRLAAGDASNEAAAGDLLVIPDERHSLEALEDCAVLLTVSLQI